MTWVKLAWANRARIIGVARKLKWSRRNWMRLLGLAVVGVGVYLVATYGYLDRFNPTGWNSAQWAQLVVNLTGFGILYVAQRLWWNRQDEVWDEVGLLREEVASLREAVSRPTPFRRDLPDHATVQRVLGDRTFTFRG